MPSQRWNLDLFGCSHLPSGVQPRKLLFGYWFFANMERWVFLAVVDSLLHHDVSRQVFQKVLLAHLNDAFCLFLLLDLRYELFSVKVEFLGGRVEPASIKELILLKITFRLIDSFLETRRFFTENSVKIVLLLEEQERRSRVRFWHFMDVLQGQRNSLELFN